MPGDKFVTTFSVDGPGLAQLEAISKKLDDIATKLGGIGGKGKGGSSIAAGALVGMHAMDHLAEAGEGLVHVGAMIAEGFGKAFDALIEKGGEFESLILTIQGTGKTRSEALGIYKESLKMAQEVPLTEEATARIARAFAGAHIDANKRLGDSYADLAKKGQGLKGLDEYMGLDAMIKKGPTATTLLADVMTRTQQLGKADQNIAATQLENWVKTGKLGSRIRFGELGPELQKIGKASHTAEGRLRSLAEFAGKEGFLGLSQAAMSTMEGQLSMFRGLIDRLTDAIMEPGQKGGLQTQFVKGLKAMYDAINPYLDDSTEKGQKFRATLKGVAEVVMGPVLASMHALAKVATVIFDFMADNKYLVMTAVGLTMVASALTVFTGAIITATAAVVGGILALVALPQLLLAIPIGVAVAIGSLGLLIGVFAALSAAYVAWQNDFGGVRTFFEGISLVIDAARDALSDWGREGATISQDLYDRLQKAGLYDLFQAVYSGLRQLEQFVRSFTAEFMKYWPMLSGEFENAWSRAAAAVGQIFGVLNRLFHAAAGDMDKGYLAMSKAVDKGTEWADIVVKFLEGVVTMANAAVDWINVAIGSVPDIIDQIGELYVLALDVFTIFKVMYHYMAAAANIMLAPWRVLWGVLKGVYHLVEGIISAIWRLLHLDFGGAAEALAGSIVKPIEDVVGGVGSALSGWNSAMLHGVQGVAAMGEFAGNTEAGRDFKGKMFSLYRGPEQKVEATPQNQAALGAGINPLTLPWNQIPTGPQPMTSSAADNAAQAAVFADVMKEVKAATPPIQLYSTIEVDGRVLGEVQASYDEEQLTSGGRPRGSRR